MTQAIALKKLYNPTAEDLEFYYDSARYVVKAGKSEMFNDFLAVHGAKKLADKNAKTANPDERKVLIAAYLENSDPKVIAERLGIKLDVILAKANEKGKEKARMANLETQVAEQNKKIEALLAKTEIPQTEEIKIDKRTKEFKDNQPK